MVFGISAVSTGVGTVGTAGLTGAAGSTGVGAVGTAGGAFGTVGAFLGAMTISPLVDVTGDLKPDE